MKIILTGGGTCGHIMPNIALLPYLQKYFNTICYTGSDKSMEQSICLRYDIPFYYTDTIKLERRKIWRNAKIPFVLTNGVNHAKQLLKTLKPNVVFAKGGFASIPTCLACQRLNIPYIIHESDTTLGVANKILAKKASKIILSHPNDLYQSDNFVVIGNPIRDEIVNGKKSGIAFKLRSNYKTILIIGGSLGASAINECIEKGVHKLTDKYNILHITGASHNNSIEVNGYYPIDFVNNIGDYYRACDLVISRAGAGAISEINAVGKRVIYIPLPKGNSRGDQVDNAEAEAVNERGMVLSQENLTVDNLINTIGASFFAPLPQSKYDKTINSRIVDEILKCCN